MRFSRTKSYYMYCRLLYGNVIGDPLLNAVHTVSLNQQTLLFPTANLLPLIDSSLMPLSFNNRL